MSVPSIMGSRPNPFPPGNTLQDHGGQERENIYQVPTAAGASPLYDSPEYEDNVCRVLLQAAKNGDLSSMIDCLSAGADVNAVDRTGNSALMLASLRGDKEQVYCLCQNGADVNQRARDGSTSVLLTVNLGLTDIVRLLCQYRADVNLHDNKGKSPLSCAAKRGHTELVKILCQNGAAVNNPGKTGMTALHLSALMGHADCVIALIEAGASGNITNTEGKTPRKLAKSSGHRGIVVILEKYDRNGRWSKFLQASSEYNNQNPYVDQDTPSPVCRMYNNVGDWENPKTHNAEERYEVIADIQNDRSYETPEGGDTHSPLGHANTSLQITGSHSHLHPLESPPPLPSRATPRQQPTPVYSIVGNGREDQVEPKGAYVKNQRPNNAEPHHEESVDRQNDKFCKISADGQTHLPPGHANTSLQITGSDSSMCPPKPSPHQPPRPLATPQHQPTPMHSIVGNGRNDQMESEAFYINMCRQKSNNSGHLNPSPGYVNTSVQISVSDSLHCSSTPPPHPPTRPLPTPPHQPTPLPRPRKTTTAPPKPTPRPRSLLIPGPDPKKTAYVSPLRVQDPQLQGTSEMVSPISSAALETMRIQWAMVRAGKDSVSSDGLEDEQSYFGDLTPSQHTQSTEESQTQIKDTYSVVYNNGTFEETSVKETYAACDNLTFEEQTSNTNLNDHNTDGNREPGTEDRESQRCNQQTQTSLHLPGQPLLYTEILCPLTPAPPLPRLTPLQNDPNVGLAGEEISRLSFVGEAQNVQFREGVPTITVSSQQREPMIPRDNQQESFQRELDFPTAPLRRRSSLVSPSGLQQMSTMASKDTTGLLLQNRVSSSADGQPERGATGVCFELQDSDRDLPLSSRKSFDHNADIRKLDNCSKGRQKKTEKKQIPDHCQCEISRMKDRIHCPKSTLRCHPHIQCKDLDEEQLQGPATRQNEVFNFKHFTGQYIEKTYDCPDNKNYDVGDDNYAQYNDSTTQSLVESTRDFIFYV